MLARESTLVHAGAVCTPSGGGMLLTGSGGVGKTTATLHLVTRHEHAYIADDMVAVSGSNLIQYPKKVQLYAYNEASLPQLEKAVLSGRGRLDRTWWRLRKGLLGPTQARRRISPESLLGRDRVTHSPVPLRSVFLLKPSPSVTRPTVHASDGGSLARVIATLLLEEFWDFARLLNAVAAIDPGEPSLADLHARTVHALERSFEGAHLHQVHVPSRVDPEALVDAVLAETPAGSLP